MDYEHFLKPLGFIALYLVFAASVRAVIKPYFPDTANWAFLVLLVVGLILMYFVYYEAYYFVREMIMPGAGLHDTGTLDALLMPVMAFLGLAFLAGSLSLYYSSGGLDSDYLPPLGFSLVLIGGALLLELSRDEGD